MPDLLHFLDVAAGWEQAAASRDGRPDTPVVRRAREMLERDGSA